MDNYNPISTPINYGMKLLKNYDGKAIDAILYKSLVKSLRYLICIRLDTLYGAQLMNQFMKEPKSTH